MDRALLFADEIGAGSLFPCAGPPCFLDDGLLGHNDLDSDDANPFPDQMVFLEYLRRRGHENAHLVVPGTVVTLAGGACRVAQPAPDDVLLAPFREKRAYLEAYRARRRPAIEAARSSWPRPGEVDVVGELQRWWGPLLAQAERVGVDVGAPLLLEAGDVGVVVDFPAREVRAYAGEHCPYAFRFEPGVMEACIRDHSVDWVNGLFLSLRFVARRDGAYNEHIYTFFKCLSEERLRYADSWALTAAADAAERASTAPGTVVRAHRRDAGDEWCQIDGWRLPARCPHLQGDLSRFGSIAGDVLTCKLHGWQFDLPSGRCLTTGEPDVIRAQRVSP